MFTVTQSVENATGARGPARALRHHRPPRHAARPEELLHPARGRDPRRGRRARRETRQYKAMRRTSTGRSGRGRPRAETHRGDARTAGSASPTTTGCRRWSPPAGQAFTAVAKYTAGDRHLPDRHAPAGDDRRRRAPPRPPTTWLFAGAKEWAMLRDYQDEKHDRPLRRRDRLGLVLLPDQADLPRAARDAQADRQHGPRDHRPHLRHQAHPLPARLQVLRLDVEDEGAAAGDGEDQGARRRRPDEDAAGDDGALQAGEGQPRRRLPADPAADPDLLLALQGDLRHHRAPPRAVLRLDPRPLGAGPDARSSTSSASCPWRRPATTSAARHHLDRGLADPARHLDVAAAEAEPDADRQDPGDDLHLDALDLHVHARQLRQRAGDLLGGEQHHHLRPAVHDHAQPGGEAERARQHPRAAEEAPRRRAECAARVSHLWRHPIKGHGVEPVAAVDARRRARPCPGTGSGRSRTRRRRSRPGRATGRLAPTSAAARSRPS